MSLEKFILLQPIPSEAEREAVLTIMKSADGNVFFAILAAIAYGIAIGKRQERARRKELSP